MISAYMSEFLAKTATLEFGEQPSAMIPLATRLAFWSYSLYVVSRSLNLKAMSSDDCSIRH